MDKIRFRYMKFTSVILLLSLTSNLYSKPKVSRYEFCWSLMHPFAALKVKKAYNRAYKLVNDAELKNELDIYSSGGKLDAFRHVYYMAAFAQKVKAKKLIKLGKAHEKTNYLQFKRHQYEEGDMPDSVNCAMDIFNNEIGIKLGELNKDKTLEQIKQLALEKVKSDNVFYILRDEQGRFIDCNNHVIDMEPYKGKWWNPKCLYGYKAQMEIESN